MARSTSSRMAVWKHDFAENVTTNRFNSSIPSIVSACCRLLMCERAWYREELASDSSPEASAASARMKSAISRAVISSRESTRRTLVAIAIVGINHETEDLGDLKNFPQLDIIINTTNDAGVYRALRKLNMSNVDILSGLSA